MMKVLVVFGTQTEAIRMCPLVQEFRALKDVEVAVCVAGQRREMLDQTLERFEVAPDFDLQIMQEEPDLHDDAASEVLCSMRKVLKEYAPNVVFVLGDTAAASVTAAACCCQHIPVACVEFE